MFKWLIKLAEDLNLVTVAADGLPTVAECKRLRTRWWHKWYIGKPDEPEVPYTHASPDIDAPWPFNDQFDFVLAQQITQKWVSMHLKRAEYKGLHWQSLDEGIGGMANKMDAYIGNLFVHTSSIEILLNSEQALILGEKNPRWWRILAHEMAHVPDGINGGPSKGHDADEFGVHLVRAKIYLERELRNAAKARI